MGEKLCDVLMIAVIGGFFVLIVPALLLLAAAKGFSIAQQAAIEDGYFSKNGQVYKVTKAAEVELSGREKADGKEDGSTGI